MASRSMFTVSVSYGSTQILIAASGLATSTEICGALAFGGEIAKRTGQHQFLFDLLAVDFEGSVADRQEMGRFAATMLGSVSRIAVVLPRHVNTGDGERAAREMGLELKNFETLDAGLAWLNG